MKAIIIFGAMLIALNVTAQAPAKLPPGQTNPIRQPGTTPDYRDKTYSNTATDTVRPGQTAPNTTPPSGDNTNINPLPATPNVPNTTPTTPSPNGTNTGQPGNPLPSNNTPVTNPPYNAPGTVPPKQ